MHSNKPYLVRAFYEWIVDCKCTPLLVVDATMPRCNVPQEYIENGEIILNVSPTAIRDLKIGNAVLEFKASFSGVAHLISAPIKAVVAIYAEENGQGMFFDPETDMDGEEWPEETTGGQQGGTKSTDTKRPTHLKLVE